MNERERRPEVLRWLRYAKEDLVAAQRIALGRGLPRHVCWLSQQAAEKAIKAVLVYAAVTFPYRHDLDGLRNLVPQGWKFKEEHPRLGRLTTWVSEARYPGDWPDATQADATAALKQAQAVIESILRDLRSHGFEPEAQP